MRSPCASCPHKRKKKDSDICAQCDKRIEYDKEVSQSSHDIPVKRAGWPKGKPKLIRSEPEAKPKRKSKASGKITRHDESRLINVLSAINHLGYHLAGDRSRNHLAIAEAKIREEMQVS